MILEKSSRYVELLIAGDALAPEQVTRLVGLVPDEAVTKGEVRPGSLLKRPSPTHRWRLIELGDSGSFVNNLLERMVRRVQGAESGLKEVAAFGNSVALNVVLYPKDDDLMGPSFDVDPEILSFLARIPASFEVNIYCC